MLLPLSDWTVPRKVVGFAASCAASENDAANTGQNYLTQVSGATGGKVYTEGFGNPVSFAPFLSDIQHKLQNQYELSFTSSSKPGLQQIKVKTSQPNTSLLYPASVPVGGVKPSQ